MYDVQFFLRSRSSFPYSGRFTAKSLDVIRYRLSEFAKHYIGSTVVASVYKGVEFQFDYYILTDGKIRKAKTGVLSL